MPRTRHRLRERIVWTPVWNSEFKGFAANFLHANLWRLDRIHQLDDLMQDAYLLFYKCKITYPRVIEAAHFMALYKRALTNSTHDKANVNQSRNSVEIFLSSDVNECCAGRIGEVTNAGYMGALIEELPEELRVMLNQLAQGLPLEPPKKQRGLQPRESLSMQLRRLFRLPINSDPLAIIKRLLAT